MRLLVFAHLACDPSTGALHRALFCSRDVGQTRPECGSSGRTSERRQASSGRHSRSSSRTTGTARLDTAKSFTKVQSINACTIRSHSLCQCTITVAIATTTTIIVITIPASVAAASATYPRRSHSPWHTPGHSSAFVQCPGPGAPQPADHTRAHVTSHSLFATLH